MKFLFIFCTFFIFTVSASAQSEIQPFLDSSKYFERLNQYETALMQLNKAIEIQPSNADLYLVRARLQRKFGDAPLAQSSILLAVSLMPDDINFLEKCAAELNLSEGYNESFKIAERLISKSDKGSIIIGYRIRYKTNFALKNYAETLEDIIRMKDLPEAFYEDRKHFINADNEDFFTDGLLIETLKNLKSDPNVFDYYRELLKIADKVPAFVTLGTLMSHRSIKLSIYTCYAEAYESRYSPAETELLFEKFVKDLSLETRAEIFLRMKKFDRAIRDYTNVLKSTTHKSTYLVERGDVYKEMKDYKNALKDYEAAKSLETETRHIDDKISAVKRLIEMQENNPHED